MKWKRLGKVFDPTDHVLPNGCAQFAQSPQTLVFDDFVRVYFSTRAVDLRNGKYLSHVAFADLHPDLRTVMRVSNQTVIPLGELGCFDEHGIFPINIVRHGSSISAFTCGWNRRLSVSVDTAIGLAESHDDGLSFVKIGAGPVMGASLHEPFLVGDAFVLFIEGTFHMWYIFGTGWKRFQEGSAPDRTYKIGHATSTDRIHWTKEEARQIVPDRLGGEESQALPTVVEIGGRYHMFFCYRHSFDFRSNRERGYRIGHAWSDDLRNWTRDDDQVRLDIPAGEWDSDMQCYPHAFKFRGKAYLLYNGNEFGRRGFGLAVLE
jgi:hypothetical protein